MSVLHAVDCAAVNSFVDNYVAALGPTNWTMVFIINLMNARNRPKCAGDWWLFIMLATVPWVTTSLVQIFPRPGAAVLSCFVWIAVWFFGFAYYYRRSTLFNVAWYRSFTNTLIGWSRYIVGFVEYFSFGLAYTFDYGRSHEWNASIVALLVALVSLVVDKYLLRRLGPEDAFIASCSYRINAANIERMTAKELASSFDHAGPQRTAAEQQLEACDEAMLDELLDFENAVIERMNRRRNNYKLLYFGAAVAVRLIIWCDRQPNYFNSVLELLVALLAVLGFLMARKGILPGIEHADAVMALSYVPDVRTVPALLRGWSTYIGANDYGGYQARFEDALSRRISKLNREYISLDELTATRVVRLLWAYYQRAPKLDDDTLETCRIIIRMPGMTANPITRRCLVKIAEANAGNQQKAVLRNAARIALEAIDLEST